LMGGQLTYRKRKKKRIIRHKREMDKYNLYVNSEQAKINLKNAIREFLDKHETKTNDDN
jgi:hypothetical protein